MTQTYVSFQERLQLATPKELERLRNHLRLKTSASRNDIETAYLKTAEHAAKKASRRLFKGQAPDYLGTLKVVYREMRSYADSLDETWHRVKSLIAQQVPHPIDSMSEAELERRIMEMYRAARTDATDKVDSGATKRQRAAHRIKTLLTKSSQSTIGHTILSTALARLPLAGTGPAGIALSVLAIGNKMIGPSYRKLIPATVELILMGERIKYLPPENDT